MRNVSLMFETREDALLTMRTHPEERPFARVSKDEL